MGPSNEIVPALRGFVELDEKCIGGKRVLNKELNTSVAKTLKKRQRWWRLIVTAWFELHNLLANI